MKTYLLMAAVVGFSFSALANTQLHSRQSLGPEIEAAIKQRHSVGPEIEAAVKQRHSVGFAFETGVVSAKNGSQLEKTQSRHRLNLNQGF
jgi:hypothetical protein